MISSGAQIRSARGFLGWSQADLAKAAGLHLNTIRKYEARHGQELHPDAQMGYVSERITIALHKAGVQLEHNPPGVFANRYLWDPEKRPPILKRWERYWKPDSKPGQERARQARIKRYAAEARRAMSD